MDGKMSKKVRCEICDRTFKDVDALMHHNKAKHPEKVPKEKRPLPIKKIRNWSIFIVVMGLIVWGIVVLINRPIMPPTSPQGHVESYPPSKIMSEPIPEPIQKHILEHVASSLGNRPGVLVQYNCEKFKCEEDLVDKLESIVKNYDYVYLAPYPQMDAKIALTKAGKLKVLDKFDKESIISFIGG
jgi:hypothetical protein